MRERFALRRPEDQATAGLVPGEIGTVPGEIGQVLGEIGQVPEDHPEETEEVPEGRIEMKEVKEVPKVQELEAQDATITALIVKICPVKVNAKALVGFKVSLFPSHGFLAVNSLIRNPSVFIMRHVVS